MVYFHRTMWEPRDWVAYINGWSFERLGYPKPPPEAYGPEKRERLTQIINAVPTHLREGAVAEAMKSLTVADRRGLFFDMGRVDSESV